MARNDRLWEKHFVTTQDLVCQAESLTTEFLDLVQVSNEHFSRVPQKWHPPNISVSKINVAVHWRSQIQVGGFGIIIRDSSGLVLAALCDTSFELGGELQLFAFAIQKALWLAKELDCQNLIVKGDCDNLLGSLRTPGPCLTYFGTLVDEIQELSSIFSTIQFNTISSSCNSASLVLARESFSFSNCKVWFGVCPDFLSNTVHNDLL